MLRGVPEKVTEPWVLVTADDKMPKAHAELIEELKATIATIDPALTDEYGSTEHWRRDVIHRWVHVIQYQDEGTIVRYSMRGRRPWKWRPKSRRPRVVDRSEGSICR